MCVRLRLGRIKEEIAADFSLAIVMRADRFHSFRQHL